MYEPFNYANGPLGTNTGSGNTNPTAPATENGFSNTNVWTAGPAPPSASNGNVAVIDGDLTYAGLPTTPTGHMAQTASNANGNPVRNGIGEYSEGSTIYYSLLLRVPSGVTNFGSSTTTGSFALSSLRRSNGSQRCFVQQRATESTAQANAPRRRNRTTP